MRQYIDPYIDVMCKLLRHERAALAGHRHAMLEQLAVARRALTLSQLINDQIDLLPESRRRLRRNAEIRRAILAEFGMARRQRPRHAAERP
ncbi:MAG: hypothetical protein ACRESV_00565 [Nevskiales bacterium]